MIALDIAGVAGRRVFISYRRQLSWPLAQLVYHNLVEHDFDAFMDVKNLDSGEFDRRILSEIEARMHFIVLLEPGSLDRIGEGGDWLQREIAHALRHGRNVVPVTAREFEFRHDLVLPPDVARLPSLQGVTVATQPEYFNAAMKLLRTKFLKPKPLAPARPVSRSDQRPRATQAPARPVELSSARAPVLPAPQLVGRVQLGQRLEEKDQVQLTWSEVSGADEYVLECTFMGMKESFWEMYRGPDRSYNGFLTAEMYRFRVRASASGQAGKWSDVWQYDVLASRRRDP